MKTADLRPSHVRFRTVAMSFDVGLCGVKGHDLRFSNPNTATCEGCRAQRAEHVRKARARFDAMTAKMAARTGGR